MMDALSQSYKRYLSRKLRFDNELSDLDGDVFSEGEQVKLRCKLEGQPLPQVTWYFNDKEIEPSEHYTIISDFNEFILMAPRATLDMSGQYRILAKNQHGARQMSTQIIVEGQFPFSPRCMK